MNKQEKRAALAQLEQLYPDAKPALNYTTAYELLVAVILSAQCTDARVNIVCKDLFRRFPDMESMASGSVEEIERLVYSCGFYKVKAQNLKDFSAIILERFEGRVPDTMEDLLTLPGVGRKIANLILGDVYGKPAIVADTHCIRISNRLGLCESKTPEKVEMTLIPLVEPGEQADFCHRLVWFGRDVCDAKKPKCAECPLRDCCEEVKLREKGEKKC